MKPFVVNRYGRIVFPFNFFPELDFRVFESLEQFAAVIKRDFEEKAPTETDIVARVEAREYRGRYDLLRDLALSLFWVNRYAMTLYEKRPTRWRDVPRHRDDVFLPVFKSWEGAELAGRGGRASGHQADGARDPRRSAEPDLAPPDVRPRSRNEEVLQFIRRVKRGRRVRPRTPAPAESRRPVRPYPPVDVRARFRVMPRFEALAVYKGEIACTNDDLIRNAAYCWSPMTAASIREKTGIEQRLGAPRGSGARGGGPRHRGLPDVRERPHGRGRLHHLAHARAREREAPRSGADAGAGLHRHVKDGTIRAPSPGRSSPGRSLRGVRAPASPSSRPESLYHVSASQRAMLSEGSPIKILLAWVAALAVAVWLLLWVGAHVQPGVEPAGPSIYTDVPEPELPAAPEIQLEPSETAPLMTF